MKYLLGLIAITALLSFQSPGELYKIVVKTIDGNKIDLSECKGKKILFIVLPLSAMDTTVTVNQIAQLQTKYQNSVTVIGIPAEEEGFKKGDEGKLKKFYKDASANIIIAERMKVKKGSGQSALLQWLTSKNHNRHFDQDAGGVGSKFFVDEAGELYAVMGPELKLTNPIIDRILTRSQGKKQ